MPKPPAAFLSYVRFENKHEEGRITALRERLEGEIRLHIGQKEFTIFYDRQISWGEEWQERIESVLDGATFFIPILTPLFFESKPCRDELDRFLRREEELKRSDLILPIYYVETDWLEDPVKKASDRLAAALARRQIVDWRELRHKRKSDFRVGKKLEEMAKNVKAALNRSIALRDLQAPRAWGCLDIPTGSHWRFRADPMGKIVAEGPSAQRHTELTTVDSHGMSLAISPDGALIAIVAKQQLRVWTVNPRSGKIYPWKGPTYIPRHYHRVLAIAPRGDLDVWLAFAEEGKQGRTLRINHADLEKAKYDEDVATEVGKGGQDTYAVFLGADLWFIEAAKMQRHAGRKNVLRKVRCGEKEDNRRTADPWAEIELVAIDAVRTGGCTYVALLFKDARNNTAEVKTQLIMVPEPADETAGSPQRSLRSAATHVSVVRAPDGDPGSLCVICGEGLNREVIFPFRETDGNMRPAAKVTAGASARGGSA